MQVPFIDLSRFTSEIRADVLRDWEHSLLHTEFVDGRPARALEAKLCELLGARHTIACGSGTDALMLVLRARGVRPGDRVAIPNCTFWATYEAVAQLGAQPVLLDIDPADLQMSFTELERAHERFGLRAAILVHAFGWASARLREFRGFCRDHGIWLIEDAAQAYGVLCDGQSVFRDAEMTTISFYPAKVIGGSQDGGAVFVADEALATKVRSLANHGRRDHYSYEHVGYNSRLGAANAYYLLRVLARAKDILESRRHTTAYYREQLAGHPHLRFVAPPAGVSENGYLSVAVLDRPCEALVQRLSERGVACRRTWPETMDAQRPAAGALKLEPLNHSRQFVKTTFNPPVFYGITADEREFVVETLKRELA